ncbi:MULTISPECIES: alkaline phosphatase family protein [Halorussus]|uniref:alkaline phosphatase family protein n=1 Tax=Halorussus TaxID=1070314 RepID=UPI00209DDE14|nr:alkaline phosphatase family protein [Halorussus vallis]USZ76537.1 alkaline phosphatase family protein [Halorussus vallis]
MTNANATVVVGFDALDFEYLDRFEESLPNFSSLRESGVEAPLRSTFPPWTGSAWPSTYTGTDPSHHGVYGFFHHESDYPDEDELVTRNRVRAPAIWNYLAARGEPAVVLNVPVTHPAEPLAGVLVPGYLAKEDDASYPEDVREELADALGEPYTIYSRGETSDDKDEKLAGYLDLVELRGRAAEYLLSEYDWRVAFVQFQKTDAVFHNFDDPAIFRRVYERADEALGRILGVAGDANVVVCSDHGIGPVEGYTVYLNEVLRQAGLLETTTDSDRPSLASRKSALTGENDADGGAADSSAGGPSVTGRAVSAATAALGRVGVSPGDAYALAQRVGVDDFITTVLPDDALSAASEGVDWRNSKCFCRTAELGVRVNLAGREPAGVVPESEYEVVREEIIDVLSSLRTPDGDPVFEWVRRREEVYGGPYTDRACDVLYMPKDMNHVVSPSLVGTAFAPLSDHDHKRDGVFLASGPDFADEARALDRLSLTDVAPATMAASGFDVPARMTGAVPEELLADSVSVSRADYGEVPFGTESVESGDDSAVEERLSDLGYI